MRLTLLAPSVSAARPLSDALALRGVTPEIATPEELRLDFGVRRRMDTIVNLVAHDPDPGRRLLLADVLAWLGDIGATVVNGLDAFIVGSSPARQLALFAHLGLRHPPARVLGSHGALPAALEDLGLQAHDAVVLDGPPLVVRSPAPEGTTRFLDYVGGRLVATRDAEGRELEPSETVARAGADLLGTASIEFGTVQVAQDPEGLLWLAADTALPRLPAVAGALAEYALFRAGLPSDQGIR
jgi:hypothetical protein